MKICTITKHLVLLILMATISTDETEDDPNIITFKAVTDPLSRKVLLKREEVPEKNLQEKEIDAEKAIIPNVTLDESGKPTYGPANPSNFDIKDVDNLDNDIMRYIKVMKYDIMLNLKTSISQSEIDHSYLIYKNLAKIKDNYFINKPTLRAKVTRLRDVTSFALDYAKEATKSQMKNLITAADVELDEYNKKILIALLDRLDQQTQKLWESTYTDLEDQMQELEKIHADAQMTPANKLSRLIECSLKLAIFEKDIVEEGTTQIKGLIALIIDNPKYHHLTQGFSESLNIKNGASMFGRVFMGLVMVVVSW